MLCEKRSTTNVSTLSNVSVKSVFVCPIIYHFIVAFMLFNATKIISLNVDKKNPCSSIIRRIEFILSHESNQIIQRTSTKRTYLVSITSL